MRAPVHVRARAITAALLAALAAAPALAVPRLEVAGTARPRRELETLAGPALRAPGDSAALASALAALTARLQSEGRLDARSSGAWDSARSVLRIEVDEGPLYRLGAVAVSAQEPGDSAAFARALGLRPGDPASPVAAAAAADRAVASIAAQGYPYARLGLSTFDPDSGDGRRVRLGFGGARGPRVTISKVRIDGLKVTRPDVAARASGRLAGRPWDQGAALAGRERLSQTGLFRSVSFEGLEGESDWSRAQIVYKVEEPRYNRFEGVAGLQGDAGTAGLANLELGNLLGTGRSAGLRWESRGRGKSDFEARYAEPMLFGAPLRLGAVVQQQIQDSTWARTRWGATARLTVGPREWLEGGYEQERVVQERGAVERADIQSTSFALERDGRDDPFAARRGVRARVVATQSFERDVLRPLETRSARGSALEFAGEWHRPLGRAAGLALELSGAGRVSSQRLLPLYDRYPVGGAASLRGWDEEAFRVDRYALSRLEWRWFLGSRGQRVFLFWDHAVMATRLALPEGGDRMDTVQKDGMGFGLRLEAAGGTVGVDYGLAPGRGFLEGKVHLRLISSF